MSSAAPALSDSVAEEGEQQDVGIAPSHNDPLSAVASRAGTAAETQAPAVAVKKTHSQKQLRNVVQHSARFVGKTLNVAKRTRGERAATAIASASSRSRKWAKESARALCSVTLLAICAAPPGIAVLLFSGMGYGEELYAWLRKHEGMSNRLLGTGVFVLSIMYLLDFSSWGSIKGDAARKRWGMAKVLLSLLTIGCFTFGLQFRAEAWPAMPPATFLLAVPFFYWAMKRLVYPTLHADRYLAALSYFKLITGIALSVYWLIWVHRGIPGTKSSGHQHYWNLQTKFIYYDRFDCPAHMFNVSCELALAAPAHAAQCAEQCGMRNASAPEGTKNASDTATDLTCAFESPGNGMLATERSDCLAAFLQWIFPFVIAMYDLVLAFACNFISRSLHAAGHDKKTHTSRHQTVAVKVLSALVLLLLVGAWVATSLAGAKMQLANAFNMFVIVGLLAILAISSSVFGWEKVKHTIAKIPIIRRMRAIAHSDWLKAALLLVAWAPYVVFLMVSWLNQRIRVRLGVPTRPVDDTDRHSRFTRRASAQLTTIRAWPWSSVLHKVLWLGVGYYTFNVGVGKIVTIVLSMLNSYLETFPLLSVIAIFYSVGLFMFLLPPVPGVPVYFAGGVIVVKKAQMDHDFYTAMLICIGVCFSIKLMAIACQQKLIGERLSGSVSVRSAVQINSLSIKAIRKILQEPGLTTAKVAILCGGPDWPTSVLTGILRLPLPQMLLGSVPVLFLIAPCVAAAAFLLRKAEGGVYQSLASLCLAVAGVTQVVVLMLAAYYIEQAGAEYKEELERIAPDQPVLDLEVRAKARTKRYKQLTAWDGENVGVLIKCVFVTGATAMATSCYLVGIMPDSCFAAFEVTDSVDVALDGSVSNIILRPWGHVAMWTLLYAVACLVVLRVWSGCLLRRHHGFGDSEEDENGGGRGSLARGDSLKANATDLEQGGNTADYQDDPASSKGSAKVELVAQQSVRGAVAVAAV